MNRHKTYLYIVVTCFALIAVVFDVLPRPTTSELEKRRLAEFPEFAWWKLWNGTYAGEISHWFSDSEPFRDEIMEASMTLKRYQSLPRDEESVTFHAAEPEIADDPEDTKASEEIKQYENRVNADADAKIPHAGIMIAGAEPNVRALMAFGGSSKGGTAMARTANHYFHALNEAVNVYCMVIPIASEFYCPDKMKKFSNPQLPIIKNCYAHLDPGVKGVDAYTPLAEHVEEDIYLRTDHHWSPLGAFYVARQFAYTADVPFRELDAYQKNTIHGFVGTMYGYSNDISVKNSPEDFVYYRPTQVEYTTTYTNFIMNDNTVVGEMKPRKGAFFGHFKDGTSQAYMTFMGGDQKIVRVNTATHNNRRLLIVKDSFGNALPGYMFYSFEEVHVVDFRYLHRSLQLYIEENNITDILLAFNIFNAYNPRVANQVDRLLTKQPSVPMPQEHAPVMEDKMPATEAITPDTLQ